MKKLNILLIFLLCASALFVMACTKTYTKTCECTIEESHTTTNPPNDTLRLGGCSFSTYSVTWEKPKNKSCEQMGDDAYVYTIDSLTGLDAGRFHFYEKRVTCK